MKLTSRWDLVKPDWSVLKVAAVTAVAAVLAVQLVLMVTNDEQARMDRFGTAAARALAGLTVEPLMRQDRLHLGVIGNRLAETPEISGVASYSSDNRVLASTGEMEGPQYTQPVTIDDSIVGYVRVAVSPPAFAEAGRERVLAMLLVALLVPLLVGMAWTLAAAVRNGELGAFVPARLRRPAAPSAAPAVDPADDSDDDSDAWEPAAEIRHYLLAVNLYNQLSLEPNEREFERSLCMELADAVAQVYQGQVVTLPGVGALVDFDHSEALDRPFQILCAAFALTRLLHDEAPFGRYRLGLNLAERPADETLPLDDPAIADAALLSALAREGTLAVSAPFAHALAPPAHALAPPAHALAPPAHALAPPAHALAHAPAPCSHAEREERFRSQALVNPLLDELTTSSPGCRLVTELAAPYATLVMQQAEQLKGQRDDAISSPSTF